MGFALRAGDKRKLGLHVVRSEIRTYCHEVRIVFTEIETLDSKTLEEDITQISETGVEEVDPFCRVIRLNSET